MELTRRDLLKSSAFAPAASAYAANDQVQVGVIGCGARSQELMTALTAHSGVRITKICDVYQGRVERTIEKTKASAAKNWREILADKSIDAVVIASPDHWHKAHVIEALRAGKDIYCEKPLTYTTDEGLEILKAVKESGRILQVGSQGVSSESNLKAREMISSGKLGQVTMIRAAYNRNTASGAWIYPIPPDASPSTVNWDEFQGSAKKHQFSLERFFRWRCYTDYSGGIATDLFVHLCTTIHFLMGAKMPSRVVAMGQLYRWKESRNVPDTLNAILEYPEGFAVNLSSTFNNESSSGASFQFLGTEGSLSLGGSVRYEPEHVVEDNRWVVESWPSRLEQAYYADPKVRASELPGTQPAKMLRGAEVFQSTGRDSTYLHFGNWLNALRTRKPHWEDALNGHRAAACAHMINQSARTKASVEWDFATENIRRS